MTSTFRLLAHPLARHRHSRLLTKVALDLGIASVAVVVAHSVLFERVPRATYAAQVWMWLAMLPLLRIGALKAFGIYRHSWRLFGNLEALKLTLPAFAVTGIALLANLLMPYVLPHVVRMPLGVLVLESLLFFTGAVGTRVAARLFDESAHRKSAWSDVQTVSRRAILVGAGKAGQLAARELAGRPDAGYEVIGFLDDDLNRRNQIIEGVPVLGTTNDTVRVAAETGVECFILTMPSATRAQRQAVVERCRQADVPVRTVPGLYELLGDKVAISKVRPLRIEDLLGREVVDFDEQTWARVQNAFTGKRILVTGAGGSIGSELCRQLAQLNPTEIVLFENNENNLFDIDNEIRAKLGDRTIAFLGDIRSEEQLERAFSTHRPQVVFHAAAYKHVPMMENYPASAIDNNVRGTRRLTEAAERHKVERFLFISTDKAVNPANVMGASKRVAEMVVQAAARRSRHTHFACVRFGNVLGSRGSVLHTFQRQIEAGGPVTLTHPDITRFFMTIPEAVRLVIQACAVSEGGEVFLLDMGEPIRIRDMAAQMIRLAGLSEDEVPIKIVGLRPGEKLFEELFREDEGAVPSAVERVFVAPLAPVDPDTLGRFLNRLEQAADDVDAKTIRRMLTMTGYRASDRDLELERVEAPQESIAAVAS